MPGCPECGFAFVAVKASSAVALDAWQYDESHSESASETIADVCAQIAEIVRSSAEGLRVRPAPGRWSPLEYACHVRDVLLVQRERVLKALRGHGDEFLPMGRDERVLHDGYNEQKPRDLAVQVEQAALLFVSLLRRLGPSEWDLKIAYMFPDPSTRTLRWIAVHTAHEVVHHLHDIEYATGS